MRTGRETHYRDRANKKIRKRYMIIVALAMITVFGVSVLFKSYHNLEAKKEVAENAEKELELLIAKERELGGELEKYSTEEGIEEIIKKNLNVKKPDEELVVIIGDKKEKASEKANANIKDGGGFLMKLFKKR